MSDKLVQYIVVRTDLIGTKNWGIGSMIAQGCHASVAAVALSRNEPQTLTYIDDHLNMTKTVLGVDNDKQLIVLAAILEDNNVSHHLWIERPENEPTALATAPALKSVVSVFFRHLKLLK